MTTPTNPGWYDDPDAPDQLRYFDGILWTSHTVARAGAPQAEPAVGEAGAAQPPMGPPAATPVPTPPMGNPYQPPPAWRTQPPRVLDRPPRVVGPTTRDGAPLASYGQRVGAFLIDGVIKIGLNLVLGGWAAYLALRPVIDEMMTAMRAGRTTSLTTSTVGVDPKWMAVWLVVTSVIGLVYSVLFLTRVGATPGKRAVGISVRSVDGAGLIDVRTAAIRYAIPFATNVFTVAPVLAFPALMLWCVDLAFPLAQPSRQALHDRLAGTQVVVGSQPRRR